jgi:hypothetical protein
MHKKTCCVGLDKPGQHRVQGGVLSWNSSSLAWPKWLECLYHAQIIEKLFYFIEKLVCFHAHEGLRKI